MHASFPYDGQRGRTEYGVRRSDSLVQSHPGLDDPLVLHNALSAAVDDGQVRLSLHLVLVDKITGIHPIGKTVMSGYILVRVTNAIRV